MQANEALRKSVQGLSEPALKMIHEYFGGTEFNATKVRTALQAINLGVKIEHMNQLKNHRDKTMSLKMIQFLPKDKKTRNAYLKLTNPEIAPFLNPRPKKLQK